MKYLVLFAVLYIAYLVWRNGRIREQREAQRPAGTAPSPQAMVSCAACGLHLPQPDALPGPRGDFYCCPEHRRRAGG